MNWSRNNFLINIYLNLKTSNFSEKKQYNTKIFKICFFKYLVKPIIPNPLGVINQNTFLMIF